MNDFLSALATAVFVLLILGLFFIFSGDPDLWDAFHQSAMRWATDE